MMTGNDRNVDEPVLGLGGDFSEELKSRFVFIRQYFNAVVSPLEERKRLIEGNHAPYIDNRNPEDYDGPAYELEWAEADEFEKTSGFLCLVLLNKAMENYIRLFLMRELKLRTIGELSKRMKGVPKGSCVMRFLNVLEAEPSNPFSWDKSPIPRFDIEDITLTRNRFVHDMQLDERSVAQNLHHFNSHPRSAFADMWWVGSYEDEEFQNNPQRLVVTRTNLLPAIDTVGAFCDYVESCRTVW